MSVTDRYDALPALPHFGDVDLQPIPAPERRHVEIVTTPAQKRARPRYVYALVCVAVLAATLVGQLLLSIAISEGAYEVSSLRNQAREAVNTKDSLTTELETVSSPQNLATLAIGMGMTVNSSPAYIRVPSGEVSGAPLAAGAVDPSLAKSIPANELLSPVEAAKKKSSKAEKADKAKSESSTPASAAGASTATAPLPYEGELPVPDTH